MKQHFSIAVRRDKPFALFSADIKKILERELGEDCQVMVEAKFVNEAEEERYYRLRDAIDRLEEDAHVMYQFGYPETGCDEDGEYFVTDSGKKCHQFTIHKDGGWQEHPLLTEMRKKKIREYGREDGIPDDVIERIIDDMELDKIIRI